jgi:LL-diaminopimelate aminotransferase
MATTHFVKSERLRKLPPYLFAEIDKKKKAAIAAGRDVINLGASCREPGVSPVCARSGIARTEAVDRRVLQEALRR